ncbi:MAG: hypothetical protein ACRD68_16055 [Pyrinomonadaceae bacterium]
MRTPLLKNCRIIRRLTALTLVLWLGGVACLIGCEIKVSAAVPQTPDAAESCPAFGGHDCCPQSKGDRAERDAASVNTLPQGHNNPSCCPLYGLPSDPARKISSADAPLALDGGGPSLPAPDAHKTSVRSAGTQRVPDRGGTYLRCCVFLI